ncbi:HAD family hydrolase [uncultured Roseobacter sp.]|uniref:HAD family hydrolase n=1 Tax=uncultured Roseobacter sp. TaxID=114847 RepID=UPI00263067CF|nr:HAD family hydrolase [uncultured Roseobacter sp.]
MLKSRTYLAKVRKTAEAGYVQDDIGKITLERPDLLVLDCDGVVIDSEVISARTLIGLLSQWDIRIDMEFVRQHFLGRSFPTVAGCVYDLFQVRLPNDFEADYRQRLFEAFETELQLVDGIEDLLDALAIPYCVATSSSPLRVTRSLDLTGVLHRFEGRIFTASQVANGKPAPDIFLHVAKTLNVQPGKCLVIEDSGVGLQAALSAGMQAVWFTGGSHMRKMDVTEIEVAGFPQGPHLTIDHFEALFEHVPSMRRGPDGENHGC